MKSAMTHREGVESSSTSSGIVVGASIRACCCSMSGCRVMAVMLATTCIHT